VFVARSKPAICLISPSLTVPKLVTSGTVAPAGRRVKPLSTICLAGPRARPGAASLAVVPWRGPRATCLRSRGDRGWKRGGVGDGSCAIADISMSLHSPGFKTFVNHVSRLLGVRSARVEAITPGGQFADCCRVGSDWAWVSARNQVPACKALPDPALLLSCFGSAVSADSPSGLPSPPPRAESFFHACHRSPLDPTALTYVNLC